MSKFLLFFRRLIRIKLLPETFRYSRKAAKETGLPIGKILKWGVYGAIRHGIKGEVFYEQELWLVKGHRHMAAAALNNRNKENYVEKIMAATGWSYEETLNKTAEAHKRTGCFYGEYLEYQFWRLTPEQQENYLLAADRYTVESRFNKDRKRNRICKNKYLADRMLQEYVKRSFCKNRGTSYAQFSELFADTPKVFYKPLTKCHGDNAQPFALTKENMREVYDQLRTLPDGIVEGYVEQHDMMKKISPHAVSTMRLVTISSRALKRPLPSGKTEELVYSALKMGGNTGVVDNLINGGLGAGIDFETGTVITDAVDVHGEHFPTHPVTGTTLKGFQIPYYREAVEMVLDCTRRFDLPGFLGWDVAITNNGPLVIEVNTDPCESLLNLPYVSDPKGFKYILAPYIKQMMEANK